MGETRLCHSAKLKEIDFFFYRVPGMPGVLNIMRFLGTKKMDEVIIYVW